MRLPPPTPSFRVVLTAGGLAEKFGGPSRTITGLAFSLREAGIDAVVVSGLAAERDGPSVIPKALEHHLQPSPVRYLGPLRLYPRMSEDIAKQVATVPNKPTVIHDNGVWGHYNWVAFSQSSRLGVPYLLSPRGMLETWSLRQKWCKKQVAMIVFQRRILIGATAFVATADSEAESIRRLGLKQPIAIVPNGIVLTDGRSDRHCESNRPRVLLFLSRIHPKKGLPMLLTAWSRTRPAGWVLRIAGPDEAGHEAEVRKRIAELGLKDCVTLVGPVEGEAKQSLLNDADVFILPTHSENFGVVVAEALNAGLPVITTTGAPWSDLERHGCGWWVEISVTAIAEAIREATSLSDAQRGEMGRLSRLYVARFSWGEVARQMKKVYEWSVGFCNKPDCVTLN